MSLSHRKHPNIIHGCPFWLLRNNVCFVKVEGGHSPLRRSSQQPTAHTHPSSSASDAQRCARGVPISQQPRYCCQGSFLCRAPLREGADQGVSPARELTSDSTSNSSSAGVSRGFEAGIGLRQTSGIKESSGFRAERAGRMTAPQPVTCSQVNDDFCDCDDGSDEPGTAACGHLVCIPSASCARTIDRPEIHNNKMPGLCITCRPHLPVLWFLHV